jgi:UDP-N-acetylmuramate: L-alanyl-gamma-D-glutamyl-meso-diaminopimelate ligase
VRAGIDDPGNVLADVDPRAVRRIHLLGVAGAGMGAFAGMLKAAGYVVTGSDQNVFPPMSDALRAWGIPILTPYDPANLDAARPDLVVVGNVIRRGNPEATAARARRLPQTSFPAALGALFLRDRHPVVVVGTHGKTTTSALMGHVLAAAGRDPSFLVGGISRNYGASYRLGRGPSVVVEGDEYDTAYFDKGPKFLHYRPRTAILTSVELDHADIYRDLGHYEAAFARFVGLLPAEGLLAVSAAYPNAVQLAREARARVVTYGVAGAGTPPADYVARDLALGPEGAGFEVVEGGHALGGARLPLGGAHNVENALGVVAAARHLGLGFGEIRDGLQSFAGVRRRQEVRAEPGGVTVIDDFAHHPTAVRETVAAIRARYPGRRLWAVFEPRSNTSRRNLHQAEYARAFTGAARVSVKVPEPHDMVPVAERLDVEQLTRALRAQGIDASAQPDVPALVAEVIAGVGPGDVLLVMSNGAFGGFLETVIARLEGAGGVAGGGGRGVAGGSE